MKEVLVSIFAFALALLPASFAHTDSIWDKSSTSPYSVSNSYKVGDLITVIILESTSAIQKAGTDTNKGDNLGLTFDHTIASMNIQPSNMIKATSSGAFKGLGSTTRQSNVTAKIASVVVKVLSNGNLVITGEHKVEVNNETQTIKITGIVRPKDVSLLNTVYSYQVAAAEVSVKGRGVVGEAESPGWFSRVFNWIF